jgi:hypothetical protein
VSCLAALGRQTGSARSLVILVGGGGRDTGRDCAAVLVRSSVWSFLSSDLFVDLVSCFFFMEIPVD